MRNSHNFRLLNIWLGADIEIIKYPLPCVFIVFNVFLGNLIHVVNEKHLNFSEIYKPLHDV